MCRLACFRDGLACSFGSLFLLQCYWLLLLGGVALALD